ncbi:MAG: thioredoxin family protein [Caldilineaceae bacterium]|nr:thioredoxin family protein [Caldilineaceae bacterium]
MEQQTFLARIKAAGRPVVVDLWAPWCGPCRTLSPRLEQVRAEFGEQVEVWQINADEELALMRSLGVMGIPTLLFYRDGAEVMRRTGVQPVGALRELFGALVTAGAPPANGLTPTTRLLRIIAGSALLVLAWSTAWQPALLLAAAVVLFSAVHDRCPLWKSIASALRPERATGAGR